MSQKGVWLAVAAVLVVAAVGVAVALLGRAPADPEVARLAEELPAELWSAIEAEFEYDAEVTAQVRAMNADLFETLPDDVALTYWVFSHPDDVAAAFATLDVLAEADVVPPYTVAVDEVVEVHLAMWDEQLTTLRNDTWLAEARLQAEAWGGETQELAQIAFAQGTHEAADDDAWLDAVDAESGELLTELANWQLAIASPIVDLERLELIEGTYLVASVADWAY